MDGYFDLAAHLSWHKAPGDGSLRALLDFAQPMAMRHFDLARPLWELAVMEGLEGGRGALVLKLHHSISDGMGLVRRRGVVDRTREAAAEKDAPEDHEAREWSQLDLVRDELAHEWRRQIGRLRRIGSGLLGAARHPLESSGELRRSLDSLRRGLAPVGEPLSPILRGRSLSARFDPLRVPLSALRAAGKKADGTLNDAFVAAVCGGLRLYHEAHNAPVQELRMTMPVNIREGDDADKAGNQFAPARFPVPIATPDPVERMRTIGALVRRERAEPVLGLIEGVAGVLNRLPRALGSRCSEGC